MTVFSSSFCVRYLAPARNAALKVRRLLSLGREPSPRASRRGRIEAVANFLVSKEDIKVSTRKQAWPN